MLDQKHRLKEHTETYRSQVDKEPKMRSKPSYMVITFFERSLSVGSCFSTHSYIFNHMGIDLGILYGSACALCGGANDFKFRICDFFLGVYFRYEEKHGIQRSYNSL